jgi:chromate reductase, NAD(P)H dehydrogenase (quinone)
MTTRPRLLGLSGSLRRDSYNGAILRTVREAIAPDAEMDIFHLGDIPLYDQDLDTDTPPEAVQALREAVDASDGLLISTPEYNYGVPGLLKNALDWASRPYGRATIAGKPVVVVTASPAFTGGVRAQGQLTETLLAIGARPLQRPQTVIGAVHEKIADGRLTDAASLNFVLAAVADLLRQADASLTIRVAA